MAKHVRKPGDPNSFGSQASSNTAPIPAAQSTPQAEPLSYVHSPNADYVGRAPQDTYYSAPDYVPVNTQTPAYGQGAGRAQGYAQGSYTQAPAYAPMPSYGQTAPDGYVPTQPRNMAVPVRKKRGRGFLKFLLTLLLFAIAAVAVYLFMLNARLALEEDTAGVRDALAARTPGQPYYVLVLGSDLREGVYNPRLGNTERADVMMLVRVDEQNKVLTMLSIPRDTPTLREDGKLGKLGHMLGGGPASSVNAVSQLTGVPISHYVEIHLSELQGLIDDLGGIEVDVPTTITVDDIVSGGASITLFEGRQVISGREAQALARARNEYEEGDVMRQQMVRQIATSIMKTALSKPLPEIPATVLNLASHVETDMNVLTLGSAALAFGTDLSNMKVYQGSGPTAGGWREDGEWYCYDNPEGWAAVMDVVKSGGDPSTVDANSYVQEAA